MNNEYKNYILSLNKKNYKNEILNNEIYFDNAINSELINELKNIKLNINNMNKNYDFKYFNLLIDYFNKQYLYFKNKNLKSKYQEIFIECINIFELSIQNNINFEEIKFLESLYVILFCIYNIYHFEIIQYIFSEKSNLSKKLFNYLSKNKLIRKFIYMFFSYPDDFKDESNYIKIKIAMNEILQNINLEISDNQNNNNDIIKEIITILSNYKNNIVLISDECINVLKNLFNQTTDINVINDFIESFLSTLIFNTSEPNIELMNFLLNVYQQILINNTKFSYQFMVKMFSYINVSQKRYEWLINNTEFKDKILNNVKNMKNQGEFIKIYLLNLCSLCSQFNYLPLEDLKILFNNLEEYMKEELNVNENEINKNNDVIDIIINNIKNLVSINNLIIDIILKKCNIIEIIKKIIFNKNYSNEKKEKILNFLEDLLRLNNKKFYFNFNLQLILDKYDNIYNKLNIIIMSYESDIDIFNGKMFTLLMFIDDLINKNNFQISFNFLNIILESLLKRINNINELNKENINKFNNIFFKLSEILSKIKIDNDSEKNILIFLNILFNFMKKINIKFEDYKLELNNELQNFNNNNIIIKTNKLFEKKNIKLYLKNLLCSTNPTICKITFEEIIKFSINNKIINSPFFLIMIIKIFYNDKNYKNLNKLFDIINECFNFNDINIKIFLHYNIVKIILKILFELYKNNNDYNIIYNSFVYIIKYLTRYQTEKLFLTIYNELNEIKNNFIINKEKEKNNMKFIEMICEKIIFYLNEKNENNNIYNNITLCKNSHKNALIYNNIYFKSVLNNNQILSFMLNLKINNLNEINNFYFLQIYGKNNSILNLYINDDNQLIVNEILYDEKYIREIEKNNIINIEKFDNIFKCDNNYHKFIVIFDLTEYDIILQIDDKNIFKKKFKFINFDYFYTYIGYIDYKYKNNCDTNEKENEKEITLIDISYLLILNDNLLNYLDIFSKENILVKQNRNFSLYYNNEIEKILIEIFFIHENINLFNSHNIKKFSKICNIKNFIFNIFCEKKYIPYIINNNVFNNDNKNSEILLLSNEDNIKEYISINRILQLENIHKKTIKFRLFNYNYGLYHSIKNTFFVDFIFNLILEFNKPKTINNFENNNIENSDENSENIRENVFNKENEVLFENNEKNENENENENENKLIIHENEILNEYYPENKLILLFIEIILNIKDKNIIKYFFEKSDILSFKLKIFFQKNIEIINDMDFITALINIFSNGINFLIDFQNINQNIDIITNLIYLYNNILFDHIIFSKSENISGYIIDYFFSLIKLLNKFSNIIENNPSIINLIYISIKKIFILICHTNIQFTLIESNDGSTIFEKIIEITIQIINLIFLSNNDLIINKTKKIVINLKNIHNKRETYLGNHYKDSSNNKSFYLNNILNSEIIKKQIEVSINKLYSYLYKINSKIEETEKKNDSKKCYFCKYLYQNFKINFTNIIENYRYDKFVQKNLCLNFMIYDEYKNNNDAENFSWYLSGKEGISRIRNKFVFKLNDINKIEKINPKTQIKTNYYKYKFNKDYYENYYNDLQNLFNLESINNHEKFYNFLIKIEKNDNKKNNKNSIMDLSNCIEIKGIHKVNSLFLLSKDNIYIYNNIILDNRKKLHINRGELNNDFWVKNEMNTVEELDKFINNKKNTPKNNNFEFNINYKLKFKKIKLSEINELYKRKFLHIENSIEIITKYGKSIFLTFKTEKRDNIYNNIIQNINTIDPILNYNSSNNININSNKFYMKYCPKNLNNNNNNFSYICDINSLLNDASYLWSKSKISNFDYIMLLNTLASRSYKTLNQYFIFPWIINNFNSLNITNNSFYRNLNYPIFAQTEHNTLKNKFDLKDEETKYHCGTFYSTHAFVCYFMIRQRPFTEIHLEIQGGVFDASDRLFSGKEQLSNLEDKYQEFIPEIFTIPEIYINTNNYDLGKRQNKLREIVDNFLFPNWSSKDPRKFTLILKKILENKKINENLNNWIDLIFGYKQKDKEAIKYFNTFRKACYPFKDDEISNLIKEGELNSVLCEKFELGCLPDQLFKSIHKNKGPCEWKKKTKIFFDDFEKIKNCKLKKLNNNNNKICINKIGNIIFNNDVDFKYFQGGISSLRSFMIATQTKYNNINNNNKDKNNNEIYNSSFTILNKNIIAFRNQKNKYISINNNNYITIIIKNVEYIYYINEPSNITCIEINQESNKLYLGFSNGNVKEYELIELIENQKGNYFKGPQQYINENNFFTFTSNEKMINNNCDYSKYNIIPTNKSFTYPSFPITHISLNLAFNILIISDFSNTIYLLSLNKNFKLIHIIFYLTDIPYPIKNILPIFNNGDFIIYTSLSVHLFSINGIPLCELNLIEKSNQNISLITCCTVAFLDDVVLFTGHKDGSINIWKIVNKDVNNNFEERISYKFNENNTKFFLEDYKYGYNSNYKIGKNEESELTRKFEKVISIENEYAKNPLKFMKLTNELNYLVIIDSKGSIYNLGCNDYNDNNNVNKIKKNNKDNLCIICKKNLDEYGRNSIFVHYNSSESKRSSNNMSFDRISNDEKNICEECNQILTNPEKFLYGY